MLSPKVGDKVLVEATVTKLSQMVGGFYAKVHGTEEFYGPGDTRPTTTRAQRLRDAAEVLREHTGEIVIDGLAYPTAYLIHKLDEFAKQLEALDAPKPPTLREAAEAYLQATSVIHPDRAIDINDKMKIAKAEGVFRAALARDAQEAGR